MPLQHKRTLEANARIENIQEFLSVTKKFDEKDAEEEETGLDRLTRFLLDLALIADTDDGDSESSEVTLMYSSCGLGSGISCCLPDWYGGNVFPLSRASRRRGRIGRETSFRLTF